MTSDVLDEPQAPAMVPDVVSVRSTRYPAGATPVDGALQDTETLEPPPAAVAVTADGAERVPVDPLPVPPPAVDQAAQAVPDTVMRTVSRRPT
ncbi:hypothetical protein GCM10009868_16940 [Terrabacter aerolatus]|uniref:Uncharacterized protein n=1 Tax=Terrabacter aerolatus TaxID=422442 RepID=A0A512D227_9MICO|nr:hypothetical protein TAE01_23260 [Terrabacter aerolatus]